MIKNISLPILEIDDLILRKLHLNDASDLYEYRSNPLNHQYTDTLPDNSLSDTINYINKMNQGIDNNKWYLWAIEHKYHKKVIGSVGIWNFNDYKAELAYGLNSNYQGFGYMYKSLKKIIDFGFNQLKLDIIEAYTDENNLSSIKLLEKLNFSYKSVIYEQGYNKNQTFNMRVYQIENYNKE